MSTVVFPDREFENRLQQVKQRMAAQGLDSLILTRPENIYYLTGYRAAKMASSVSRFHAVVVPLEGEPRLFTRVLEREVAKIQWTKNPVLYMDHENPFTLVANVLAEARHGKNSTKMKVGVENTALTVWQFENLKAALSNSEFVDVTGLVDSIRVVPSKLESEFIRKAAKITAKGFDAGIDACRVGAYRYDVLAAIQAALFKAGQTDFDSSFVAVWSGPKGGRMHDTSTEEKINEGDTITLEVQGIYNQYKAVSQGTLFAGKSTPIPSFLSDTFNLVSKMFRSGREALKKPKVTAGEVYDAANSQYRPSHGADYFRRVGGTVGISVFDIDFRKGRSEVLQPGMGLIVQALVDDPVLVCCVSTMMITENGLDELTTPILEPRRV